MRPILFPPFAHSGHTQTFLDGWQAACDAAPLDANGNRTVQMQLHECMSAVTLDIIAAAAFGSAALSSVETRALFYEVSVWGSDVTGTNQWR